MPVMLRTIQTAVPERLLRQDEVRDVFALQPGLSRLGQRLIATSFDSSAINTRYSCVKDFDAKHPPANPLFYDASTQLLHSPSTATRNREYVAHAPALFIGAAQKALDYCPDLTPADITHVITVSCTGFYNPGPDYQIVRALGLKPNTVRHHLGFMGCYAAFPALRAAKDFCLADPQATVLVACAELCTLHVHSSNDPDTIMGSALFADGAAAAIVTARGDSGLSMDAFETVLTPVGEEAMAWNIGDEGFEMVLGTYVPHIIDEHISGALEPLFAKASIPETSFAQIKHWGIHPGGRAILDRVQNRLELSDTQLAPARKVLAEYGNMSSATVLFVLKEIMDDRQANSGERVCAMAFGPGLTVETGLFTLHGEAE
ncbi:type III polyketide synthase [Arthrobacter sp. MYb211]|uniref:type III polyketide synthase n=1 Tax=unclassified Arthrobacter TaxID=235627 RepID=UPI000CFE1CA5|nr:MULTISPECIES: type III polyketide synthase [unclassified Arthrobacter]PRA12260.1 type III polyketide synthase [Arthrobacter sp. MYb221]PRC08723.1 type III polyketide synthase [Arthrobacter sp. MYb211]